MAQSVEFDSGGDGTVLAVPQKQSEPIQVRHPLLSEILTRVHKAKHTKDKEKILKEEDCQALRQILKWNFDPNIQTELPEGTPPYVANEAPEGTEHTLLRTEANNLWHFVMVNGKPADPNMQKTIMERTFTRLLEGLHKDEAKLLIAVKDKKLAYNQKEKTGIKGLSIPILQEAFNWDENFKKKNV